MKPTPAVLLLLVGVSLSWNGCTLPSAQPLVPAAQAGVMHTLELGTVMAVKEVTLEGERTNLGLYGGAAVGGAAALPQGSINTGDVVVQAAAAVVGAVAGQAIEEAATRERAQEITIRMDNGRTVMITQAVPDGPFREGDRVQVAHGPNSALVRLALN